MSRLGTGIEIPRKRIRRPLWFLLFYLTGILLTPACRKETVPQEYKPTNAHEAYLFGLEQAGLADSALARDWAAVSQECLAEVIPVSAPFKETFYVDPEAAFAVAYSFDVRRGQRTEIAVEREGRESARIFMDLFRVEGDSPEFWVKVASAGETESRLEFEPRLSLPYAVRLQPELLRGGRFTVTIRVVPSLGFPVAGADSRDIGSGFGAPRDGGRREHHGVDIFARRHTPILAPSDGYIRRAGEQPVGGRTVWLWDQKRGLNMYFAHLQEHRVTAGETVTEGQMLGTVGNTGNARTTPPHLHFGIYIRGSGAVDPVDFITKTDDTPTPVTAGLDILGSWARVSGRGAPLYSAPQGRTTAIPQLETRAPLLVTAAAGERYRIRLPNGVSGYIPSDRIEPASSGYEQMIAEQTAPIMESLSEDAVTKAWIKPGGEVDVLGRFRDYRLIRTEAGLTGWVSIPQPGDSDDS